MHPFFFFHHVTIRKGGERSCFSVKKRAVREKEDIHAFSFCQRNVTHCTPLLFSSLLIVNQNFDLNNMRTKSKILLFTCLTKILDRAVHQFVQNVSVVFCGVLHLCERLFVARCLQRWLL